MASFLNAALPSSDEEDDDYRPEVDKTAAAEDRAELLAQKRAREAGDGKGGDEGDEDVGDHGTAALLGDFPPDSRTQAKRAKINHLWELLNGRAPAAGPSQEEAQPAAAGSRHAEEGGAEQTTVPSAVATPGRVGPSRAVPLASLCRTVGAKERKKMDSDMLWMNNLGITPPRGRPANGVPAVVAAAKTTPAAAQPQQSDLAEPGSSGAGPAAPPQHPQHPQPSEAAVAAAAAALAAARSGSSLAAARNQGKVVVTETRRFAGKDVQVTLAVDKGSKEAARAAAATKLAAPQGQARSGLDAFLDEIAKKKKVTVLDKSKADWQQVKASDTALEEELDAHRRSGNQYLDKVDFLKRAEVREYELERDKRLASDMRTRGRL